MKKRLLLLPLLLLIFFISPCTPALAGSVSTVSSLMTDLLKENKESVYDVNLNAPFSKETSGIRENISSETGGLVFSTAIFNIPGRNGNDLALNLAYSNLDAALYRETTKSASISQSYGQTVIAYYDVYDSADHWLYTGAYKYTTDDTSVAETMTIDGENWVFNGYMQYESGTSLFKSSSIANYSGSESKVNTAKNVFGAGWSLYTPSLQISDDTVYVTLMDGQTYVADFLAGCGLKDYPLYDIVFTKDTSQTNGTDASAYKLYYAGGEAYYYNADGELILQADRYNNTITYYWEDVDGLSLLTKIADSAGHIINIQYNDTQTVFTCGNKTVRAIKSPIPGEEGKYYLSEIIDAAGRHTKFSYSLQTAAFDTLSKTEAQNKYANLIGVTYPTGLITSYNYTQSTKNLGDSGSMAYSKIKQRYDIDNGKVYNLLKYNYYNEPDGYPQYKADAIGDKYKYYSEVVESSGLVTRYLYNSDHLLYQKQQETGRLLNETLYRYDVNSELPTRIESRTYNVAGDRVSKVDSYEYDYRGNVIAAYHPAAGSPEKAEEYKTAYTYDYDYNLLTKKAYKQDKDTFVIVRYNLTADKKSAGSEVVYANGTVLSHKTYTYDSFGNVTAISVKQDSRNWAKTVYEYGREYNGAYVTAVIFKNIQDADGKARDIKQAYTYDLASGNQLSFTDGNGNVTYYTYDNLNRVIKETLPDGTYKANIYDDANNILTVTDPGGGSLKYDYNGLGKLVRVTEPASGAVLAKFMYDTNENKIAAADGNGNSRLFAYDALTRLTSVTSYDDGSKLMAQSKLSYNEAYREDFANPVNKIAVVQKGDKGSLTNNYYYDVFERLIRQETVSGDGVQTSAYAYDYLGNNTALKGIDGQKTYYFYDALGNLLRAKDPAGNFTTYAYDGLGQQISVTDPLGSTSFTQYDALGRTTAVKTPYQGNAYSVSKYYYDGAGNVVQMTDPEGYETKYYYTGRNFCSAVEQVISAQEANIVKMSYDANGNVTELKTGLHAWDDDDYALTRYKYDSLGRQIEAIDALQNSTTYQYDNNGNLIQTTDRNGVTTYYSYDGLNRLILQYNSKDGLSDKITTAYGLLGNVLSAANSAGEISYEYDGFGRLTREKDDSSVSKYYTYDSANRVSGFQVKQGSIDVIDLAYGYDQVGRLTSVKDEGRTFSYNYDAAGHLVQAENGVTGLTSDYSYYASGQLKNLIYDNGNTQTALQYQYDARGYQTEKDAGGETTTYRYDALGRIQTAFLPDDRTQDYTYDDFGNIAGLVEIDGTLISESSYLYDKANHLIYKEEACGADRTQETFTYDHNGNLTAKDRTYKYNGSVTASEDYTYYYNGYNQFTRLVDADNDIYDYTYNAMGLRTQKACGEDVTNYYYDGSASIILETDESYSVTARNIRGRDLLYRETPDETYYYLPDAHGDIIGLTDGMGNITSSYAYDPFGNEETPALQGFGLNSTVTLWRTEVEKADNPFGYCGEYLDEESGLIYLRGRYYDPDTARFTQEDPTQNGFNGYAYCGNNPVNCWDPSGYITEQEQKDYEDGKMAPAAYTYLMKLTYDYYLADTKEEREAAHQAAEDFRSTGYTKTGIKSYDAEMLVMSSKPSGDITKGEHYFRNKLNLQYSWSDFQTLQNRLPDNLKWVECTEKEAKLHQHNNSDNSNVKYVSADGHFEMVFDKNHVLQTQYNNPADMGTYNYSPFKDTYLGHFNNDIFPYYRWGNVP